MDMPTATHAKSSAGVFLKEDAAASIVAVDSVPLPPDTRASLLLLVLPEDGSKS